MLMCASCVLVKKMPHLRRGKDWVKTVCRYQPMIMTEVAKTQDRARDCSKVMVIHLMLHSWEPEGPRWRVMQLWLV